MPAFEALPLNAAKVKDISLLGEDVPLVFLIEDIHLNFEAQKNIASVLESLSTNKNLVIGVEGAFGPFNFTKLRDFPDKKIVTLSA